MLDVRPVLDDDALAAALSVISQAFTTPGDAAAYVDQVGRENFRLASLAGDPVGAMATFWMGHWFGGRAVPAVGIAAVGVPPVQRGTGVAVEMVAAVLREARERGVSLASLYASTQVPYRRVGFEQAGLRNRYQVALREIRPLGRELEVRAIDPTDVARLERMYRVWAATQAGPLARTDGLWKRVSRGDHTYAVELGPKEAPEGYLVWSQEKGTSPFYDIVVRDRVALTPAASRHLWTLLADHRSMASTLHLAGAGHDPWLVHLGEWRSVTTTTFEPWFLRVIDAKGALEGRGWAPDVDGALDLTYDDPVFPDQSGPWRLEVSGGLARLGRGGSGGLRLGPRGLAPLYSGTWTAGQLAAHGLIEGAPTVVAAAERLFAGPAPWLPDHF